MELSSESVKSESLKTFQNESLSLFKVMDGRVMFGEKIGSIIGTFVPIKLKFFVCDMVS